MRLAGFSSRSIRRIAQAVAEQPVQEQDVNPQQQQDIQNAISYISSAVQTLKPYSSLYDFDDYGRKVKFSDYVNSMNSMVEFLDWFNATR